jgi:hypothetical protein
MTRLRAAVPHYTERYAVNIFGGRYRAGDADENNLSGKTACRFLGVKDWGKPVMIKWAWETEEDAKTKAIAMTP